MIPSHRLYEYFCQAPLESTTITPEGQAALTALMTKMLGREIGPGEMQDLTEYLRAWLKAQGARLVLHGQPIFRED